MIETNSWIKKFLEFALIFSTSIIKYKPPIRSVRKPKNEKLNSRNEIIDKTALIVIHHTRINQNPRVVA